jgi:AcrR family transcriptional regulator
VAVRASLIDAATQLFASRGPAQVSVREIAEAAGVNHGLVHHYFGSKEALLHEALDSLARQAAKEISEWQGGELVFAEDGAIERHGRIVAHLLLASGEPAVQTEFPAVRALVRELRRRGLGEADARERAAQVTALVLGWQLFEPFLTRAAELDSDRSSRAARLGDGVRRLLTP